VDVLRKIVFVAGLAGLISGFLVTAAHHFGTAAIISRAEVYERAAEDTGAAAMESMPGMSHDSDVAEWGPRDGFERTVYTVLADILTGIGFALLLAAAFAIRGDSVDWRKGLYWGLAGFATFTLAPSLGLPPEVPGTAAAPLLERQIWWIATAIATGGGLALLFFTRRAVWTLLGIALLLLPNLYGAPQPLEYKSAAPESLAHEFVVATILTSLFFWLVLGSLTGFFYKQLR
jgi:cobalt transporter subunit CbtA